MYVDHIISSHGHKHIHEAEWSTLNELNWRSMKDKAEISCQCQQLMSVCPIHYWNEPLFNAHVFSCPIHLNLHYRYKEAELQVGSGYKSDMQQMGLGNIMELEQTLIDSFCEALLYARKQTNLPPHRHQTCSGSPAYDGDAALWFLFITWNLYK